MHMLIMIIAISLVGIFFIFCVVHYIKMRENIRYLQNDLSILSTKNDQLIVEKIELIRLSDEYRIKVEQQEQLIIEFDKLRNESKEFTKAALFELGSDLSKQLIEIHKKENQESRDLSEKKISEISSRYSQEFERLIELIAKVNKDVDRSKDTVDLIKNALLSPSGAGSLAEITLENVLKNSGLRVGVDFNIQHTVPGKQSGNLRPDAVIFLPGNNVMVIDAKSSKFLFEDFGESVLSKTLNNHLKSLSSKDYASSVADSLDSNHVANVITLMFLPSEQAVEKIIESDRNFLTKAWEKNIFPVGPSGLMNMLSFAKFQIGEQLMLENYRNIIEEVKKLLSSVGSLAEHSSRLGHGIGQLAVSYDKFAASFNRNFLSKARAVVRYGVECDNSKLKSPLKRYQLISSNSELIEVENEIEFEEAKKLENA